MGEMTNSVKA